ncbi:MAG: lycopene beta-cyclase CrtY [Deltaproteobacteria bacterium]|nr:lycopene beta-cyclase CrtY [Deltaproteobacteria bacterium]
MSQTMQFDCLLVGGGLQNALIAMALIERQPATRLALIERDSRLGGNHLWCFHARDVPPDARGFVDPLVAHRWPAYEVAFPELTRRMDVEYLGITSDRLHEVVSQRVAASSSATLFCNAAVERVTAGSVVLADGRTLRGALVVDSRGPERLQAQGRTAYQKFLGLEVALAEAQPGFVPKLMDAQVPQTDGYRFFYTLPLAPERFLVEDTYYADGPQLDRERIRGEILAYAQRIGLHVTNVVREETGVLPLTTRPLSPPIRDGVLVGGYAGGWFHPTTGYSFPVALRLARYLASADLRQPFGEGWNRLVAHRQSQARYFNLLNRFLFGAMPPDQRRNAFELFYRQSEAMILRFYAMDVTLTDRLRLFAGRAPRGLSLRAALSALLPR